MTKSDLLKDEPHNKTTMVDIPLLSLDRSSVVGKATLFHREENRNHFITVIDGPNSIGLVFDGWSAKVALDKVRENFEKNGSLIVLGGALVYATYSGMCHDMGGGYAGYNYKNREQGDMTIPIKISTFSEVDSSEYPFVSTLAEQKGFSENPEEWRKIIKSMAKRKLTLKSFLKLFTGR